MYITLSLKVDISHCLKKRKHLAWLGLLRQHKHNSHSKSSFTMDLQIIWHIV